MDDLQAELTKDAEFLKAPTAARGQLAAELDKVNARMTQNREKLQKALTESQGIADWQRKFADALNPPAEIAGPPKPTKSVGGLREPGKELPDNAIIGALKSESDAVIKLQGQYQELFGVEIGTRRALVEAAIERGDFSKQGQKLATDEQLTLLRQKADAADFLEAEKRKAAAQIEVRRNTEAYLVTLGVENDGLLSGDRAQAWFDAPKH